MYVRGLRGEQPDPVTGKELEVLTEIKKHLSNKEIAEVLKTSIRTVKSHVSNLLHKAGAKQRAELVTWNPALTNHFGFYFLYSNLSSTDKKVLQYIACGLELPEIEKVLELENLKSRMEHVSYALGWTEEKLGFIPNFREEIIRWVNFCRLVTPKISNESDEIRRKRNKGNLRVLGGKTKEAV